MLEFVCECGKKTALTDRAISSHLRSNLHTKDKKSNLYVSPKKRQLIIHEAIKATCEKGTLSRQPSNHSEERKLVRDLGIS